MRRMAMLCATAAIIALVGGPASHLAAAADDNPNVPPGHEVVQKLIDAENRDDVAGMAALFSEDAILLPPGGAEPIKGRDSIRKFFKDRAPHKIDTKITPSVVLLGGPKTMIEAGTWSGDVAEEGAPATGTYLAVGIFVDGQWKLWASSWQAKPPTGASEASTPPQVGTSTPKE